MMFAGIFGIFSREMLILKSRFIKTLLSASVSPLLFLLAFGYGIGRAAQVDGVDYLVFLIPGLITMGSMNTAYGISTEINISRFYFKVFEEYLIAPIPRWQIVAGEVMYGMTKGLIPTIVVLAYAFAFDVHLTIDAAFAVGLAMHLAVFALLGFIIALIVRNHGDQFAFNTFVITPMVFLSGTFYPVEKMPGVIKYLVMVFPLTYSTRIIRGALLGEGFVVPAYYGILAVIMVILFAVAVRVVRTVEA